MTALIEPTQPPQDSDHPHRAGRWIDHWDPEHDDFWNNGGKAIAFRNLCFSIFAEHVGFSVWLLWSIVNVKLLGEYNEAGELVQAGANGWALTAEQGFTLLAVVSAVGAFLRIPYTFAVPIFGGRNWTVISASLLLIPTLGLAWVVQHPEVGFGTLMIIAATAGFGGGNFASSMTNINFFYRDADKGWALGLNAAGGNIGVAVAQKLVPFVIGFGALGLSNAGLVYVPLIVASGVMAFLFMNNLTEAKAPVTPTLNSTKHPDTWIMAFLYVGTFGSFIGYSAAFPTLLAVVFDASDLALTWGFLGALLGSLARPFGGRLADKFGGAIITFWTFLGMAVAGYVAIVAVRSESLPLYFAAFLSLFLLTGIGNGSTYRMIPSIFTRVAAERGSATSDAVRLEFKRRASAAVGLISAVGACGGAAIPWVYKWSKQTFDGSIIPAMQIYVGLFVLMAVVTWVFYLRRSATMAGV